MTGLSNARNSLAPQRQRLIERVRKRRITRVVYFHTDHFEPCRNFDGRPIFGDANIRDTERFAETMSRIEFGRRPTLFYKPQLNFEVRTGSDMMFASPEDKLGFVHHENYTSNATVTTHDTAVGHYLCTAEGAARDSARFEFAVKLNLALLASETGRTFDRWFFVHGHWALNASDDKDCRIVDEIEILHRNGCRGDFTFPAGRTHVDSRHELPYLCRPVNSPKGYDTLEAEPEPAAGAGVGRGEERFLIWGSLIKHGATSIDHNSGFVQRRSENVEAAAAKLIDTSYLHDGTLYVKTHAHSMHPAYFDGSAPACFPHEYPATRDMLSLVFDAAADGGAEISFETASEVYNRLLTSSVRSTVDMTQAFSPSRSRLAFFGRSTVAGKSVAAKPPKVAAQASQPSSAGILNPAIQYAAATRLVKARSGTGLGGWLRTRLSRPPKTSR
jgi:hypothetical protein